MLKVDDLSTVKLVESDWFGGRYGPGIDIYRTATPEKLSRLETIQWATGFPLFIAGCAVLVTWSTWARYYAIALGVVLLIANLTAAKLHSDAKPEVHIIDGPGSYLWQSTFDDLIPYQDDYPEFVIPTALDMIEDYYQWVALDMIHDERSKESMVEWARLIRDFEECIKAAPAAELGMVGRRTREGLINRMPECPELPPDAA